MTCTHTSCSKPVLRKALCHEHLLLAYARWKAEQARNSNECKTDGCELVAARVRLCRKHYAESRAEALGPCTVAACDQTAVTTGLCNAHRIRKDRYGHPLAGPTTALAVTTTCTIDDCAKTKIKARGMCEAHYMRAYRAEKAGINVGQALTSTEVKPRNSRLKGMCEQTNCTEPQHGRGLCSKHYMADYHQRRKSSDRPEVSVAA
jgi:hypothetical protein